MILSSALLAFAQATALPDTIVTVQATSRGWALWVDTLTGIASVVIALALIALSVALIPAALNSRKMYRRVNEMLKRVEANLNPIVRHVHDVADNANYVSTAVRTDVQRLQQTIASTHDRLDRAAALAEARINDFNALLKVVQEEAEDLFIDTAATIRGVQVGTGTLRRFRAEDEEWDHDDDDEPDFVDEEDEEPEIRVERIPRDR